MSLALGNVAERHNTPVHEKESERRFFSPDVFFRDSGISGNPVITRSMEILRPVCVSTDMLRVLEVFRDNKQEHYFPVLDTEGRSLGLICEPSLKGYVYSAFGVALLSNKSTNRHLSHFVTPCPVSNVDDDVDELLRQAHSCPTAEGVIIQCQGRYVGFIRAAALVDILHNRQMEIIRAHTSAIDKKNRDIQAVLQNMRQGMCNLLPDLTLNQDYSAYLGDILENDALAGQNLMDLIFNRSSLGVDRLQQIEAVLTAVPDQDELTFELKAHLLPSEIEVSLADKKKLLELHWSPVIDENDQVARIMLVVRDVTQMRELQRQAAQQKHELQLLGEILSAGEKNFLGFIEASKAYLDVCREALFKATQSDGFGEEFLSVCYRSLHTIKGNARTLGMLAVTDTIHLAEQSIQDVRDGGSVFNEEAFSMLLGDAEAQLSHYVQLYDQCLRGFSQARIEASVSIDDSFWKELEDLACHQEDRRLARLLEKQRQPSFSSIISDVCSRLESVAGELGKPEPRVMLAESLSTTRLRSEFRTRFTDALTHIFRNNLDHGIEEPAARILEGKPEEGLIRIEFSESPTGISLWISDDGRGLNIRALRSRWLMADHLDRVTLSDDEVAELIFRSGITTAETVSMISGRGVGMDAVRCLFESMGGSCIVVLDDAIENTDGYRPFKLKIDLSATCVA